MMLFRGMRPDPGDMLPLVDDSAGGLGVRERIDGNGDIPVVNGCVQPLTGGMSVSVNPMALPGYRRPRAFGGTNDKFKIYAYAEDTLPDALISRQDDPIDSPCHRSIEPVRVMMLQDFREAIRSTRAFWRLHEND